MRNLIFVAAMLVCFGCARDEQASSTTSAATPPPPDQSTPQGGPAEISTMAVTLEPTQGNATRGTLTLAPVAAGGVRISGSISGLKHNSEHGFHIHETGKCEAPEFTTAGGHFNPTKAAHGFLDPKGAHAGDMPNVFVAQGQKLEVEVLAPGVTLDSSATGLRDADGSSLVLHAAPDDYKTAPAGAAGARQACGVISPAK